MAKTRVGKPGQGRMFSTSLAGNTVFYPEGMGPATVFFVDGTNGAAGNDGLSWERAFSTITLGMSAVATLAARGRGIVLVAPGGYTEDVQTPLNTASPFGALIAVNPTGRQSFGATWITASTAGAPCILVRARGWLIQGFELDALADANCIDLDGATASSNAAGTEIADCLLVGQNQGLYGIDVTGNGAPHTKIHDNGFYGFTSGSTAGACIASTSSGTDQARFWQVEDNWFGDSDNLIDMNPRGFKESVIRRNTFFANGANQNPDEKIDNTGGNDTIIYQNSFGGTYSNVGGYVAGTNDEWGGNFNSLAGGLTAADPA